MTDHQITGPLHLRLRLHAGLITVTTNDDPVAHVEVRALRDDDNCRKRAAEVRQELRARGAAHELVVAASGKGALFGWRDDCPLAFDIRAPHGCSLDCETSSADIEGVGSFGRVAVRSASGEVRLGDIGADAEIKSASGTVEIGAVAGSARISGVSGDVRIGSATGDVTVSLV